MNRFLTTIAVAGSVAALLTGCSNNAAGATKCKDFNTQDHKTQDSEVAAMLKQEKGKEASELEITATRLSATAFCKTLGKQDSTISDINHG